MTKTDRNSSSHQDVASNPMGRATPEKTVILVTRTVLGTVAQGDEPFGSEMLDMFFHTLESQSQKPYAMCFYTEGVKVVCEGSPHVVGLKLLEGLGVKLLACQTCLDHYHLTARLAVGRAAGMAAIVGLMNEADQVVTV